MDQNAPLTTPEPTPEPILEPTPEITPEPARVVKPVDTSASGMISLVTGLLTWVVTFFSGLLDISALLAGFIALISAIMAVFFGAKAKRVNPASKAGKVGRILGWLYLGLIILAILATIVLFIVGGSLLANWLGTLGI